MHRVEPDIMDDEPTAANETEPVIDFESDQIDIRGEGEADHAGSGLFSGDQDRMIDNADLDNLLDEFVDVVNGRDLDGLGELLAADAEAEFLGEMSGRGVADGFNDLFLRYPTLLVTRGDIGSDPIVAVWIFDRVADRFDPFGYMTLEVSDSEDPLIQRVVYTDELSNVEDLVVETPERSELPEWEDWSELDED